MSPWGCADSANFHCSSSERWGWKSHLWVFWGHGKCRSPRWVWPPGCSAILAPVRGHVLQLLPQLLLSQGPHSFFSLLQMTHCTLHNKLKATQSSGLIPPNLSTYIFPITTSFPLSDERTWPFCSSTVTLPGPWACLSGRLLAPVFHFSWIASFPTAYKELLPHWSHVLHATLPERTIFTCPSSSSLPFTLN